MLAAERLKIPLYMAMGRAFLSWMNATATGNTEWAPRHRASLDAMVDSLPHGCGIDGTTAFDYDRSKDENHLVITTEFHTMDPNGFYGRWLTAKLIVVASIPFGFELHVTGAKDEADFLAETFEDALRQPVDEFSFGGR